MVSEYKACLCKVDGYLYATGIRVVFDAAGHAVLIVSWIGIIPMASILQYRYSNIIHYFLNILFIVPLLLGRPLYLNDVDVLNNLDGLRALSMTERALG